MRVNLRYDWPAVLIFGMVAVFMLNSLAVLLGGH